MYDPAYKSEHNPNGFVDPRLANKARGSVAGNNVFSAIQRPAKYMGREMRSSSRASSASKIGKGSRYANPNVNFEQISDISGKD